MGFHELIVRPLLLLLVMLFSPPAHNLRWQPLLTSSGVR